MELKADKTTKILLGAIALGLFLNASDVIITKAFAYDYDVSGYGGSGYVSGQIETDGDGDAEGYLHLEDGSTVYFDGEFSGYGEVEGYDENGDYYNLEVD
jgi:hypothetical protein